MSKELEQHPEQEDGTKDEHAAFEAWCAVEMGVPAEDIIGATGDDLLACWRAARATMAQPSPAQQVVPEKWARYDTSFLLEHLRHDTNFDADVIGEMLEFAKSAAQQAIPEGWKLVPTELTKEMKEAMIAPDGRTEDGYIHAFTAKSQWAAVLAAAPQPAKEGESDE
ncbi:hypothetical protein D3C78_401770 [compost metagenome]